MFSRLASWGRYMIGDTYSAANDGLKGQVVADLAERGEPRHVRHAARHRHQRRPAHGAVAAAVRQRPEVVADARRGVGPPARDDRRLRRRRAPRPHVRRAVHHVVPRRLVARPSARLARTLRAADDADARAALRPARPRRASREGYRADLVVLRSRDGRDRRGEARRRPARRHEPALRRRDRRAARDRERHRRSSPTASPTDARPGTVLRSGRDTYTVPIPADA